MIKVEKLTHGFPAKDLYNDISFTLEAGQHAVLIGSNGSGKSTLVDMIINTDDYWFDGKITKAEIMAQCPDISQTTIQRALNDLVKSGEVIKIGGGRYTSYTWNREID